MLSVEKINNHEKENEQLKAKIATIEQIAGTHTELCTDCAEQLKDSECNEICNAHKLLQILEIIRGEQ